MRERPPRLHNFDTYRRWGVVRHGVRSLGRTGCALLAVGFGAYSIDLGYSLASEPDRNSVMRWAGTIACRDAKLAVVHLSSTGKDIAEFQAANNRQAIEDNEGAILVTEYDTKGDIGEFRDHLDEKLAECARPDRPYVPVVMNGVSLGGKYAQWVANAGLKNGIVIANVLESTPVDPDTIRDEAAAALVGISKPETPIPMTKGIVFLNALSTEVDRRGPVGLFTTPQAFPDVLASSEGTSAKKLTWQISANAQPWPIPVRPTDNTVPIEYIYSELDSVVDTAMARAQLKLFTRAEVTEHRIAPDTSWGKEKEAPNHGDGWRLDATNAAEYRDAYAAIYRKYSTLIDQRKQAVAANSLVGRDGRGPV